MCRHCFDLGACIVHYSLVYRSAVPFSEVNYREGQCSAVQRSAEKLVAVQCRAVRCNAVQSSTLQCSAVQLGAVQCSTVHFSAVQCSSKQYSSSYLGVMERRKRDCRPRPDMSGKTDIFF